MEDLNPEEEADSMQLGLQSSIFSQIEQMYQSTTRIADSEKKYENKAVSGKNSVGTTGSAKSNSTRTDSSGRLKSSFMKKYSSNLANRPSSKANIYEQSLRNIPLTDLKNSESSISEIIKSFPPKDSSDNSVREIPKHTTVETQSQFRDSNIDREKVNNQSSAIVTKEDASVMDVSLHDNVTESKEILDNKNQSVMLKENSNSHMVTDLDSCESIQTMDTCDRRNSEKSLDFQSNEGKQTSESMMTAEDRSVTGDTLTNRDLQVSKHQENDRKSQVLEKTKSSEVC